MKSNIDWMHDTACCFGYPSDSSWTARKRTGSLDKTGPRHRSGPPSDARPRQRSTMLPPSPRRPSCGRARRRLPGPASSGRSGRPPPPAPAPCADGTVPTLLTLPGRCRALPASRRPWMSAGLHWAVTDRRHDRHGRPRKGRTWGVVRAGAAAGGSPSAS